MASKYEVLKIQTKNMALVWKTARGIIPGSVADKMDDAMLDWTVQLTDTLQIWIDKGSSMTDGELILARVNMGALVEAWLKFFFCVHYIDYLRNPNTDKKGKTVEPEKMSFEDLKNYATGILWPNQNDPLYIFVDKIQHYRNAIHSFRYRDIGKAVDYVGDVDDYYNFIDTIVSRIPPIEDLLGSYPKGYKQIPLF